MPWNQVTFMIVLVLLATVAAIFWFADPGHWPNGPSRINWPPASAHKP